MDAACRVKLGGGVTSSRATPRQWLSPQFPLRLEEKTIGESEKVQEMTNGWAWGVDESQAMLHRRTCMHEVASTGCVARMRECPCHSISAKKTMPSPTSGPGLSAVEERRREPKPSAVRSEGARSSQVKSRWSCRNRDTTSGQVRFSFIVLTETIQV